MSIGQAIGHILVELRETPRWRLRRIAQLRAAVDVLTPMYERQVEASLAAFEAAAREVGDPDMVASAGRLRAMLEGAPGR